MRFIALFFLHGSSAFGTPYSIIRMVIRIQFYTLEEAKEVYGESNLVPISQIKQIIFYTKFGCQPKFIWESEKEEGRIVAWFHRKETQLVYERWMSNRPQRH